MPSNSECFKKVMMAVDFSECSLSMLNHLDELEKAGTEEIVFIRVINLTKFTGAVAGFDIDAWVEIQEEEAMKKLEELVKKVEKFGLKAKFVHPIPVGDPVGEIVEAAKKEGASSIMLASRGKSRIKEILLGSVSEGVIRKADRPVLLLKSGKGCYSGKMFKKILYAHDLSEHSADVVHCVKEAALAGGRDVVILHVEEKDERGDKRLLKEAEEVLKKAGINVKVLIREGIPHKVILRTAEEEEATMIAMASRGLGFIEGMILGSTTDVVTRRSKVPVLVHRHPRHPESNQN